MKDNYCRIRQERSFLGRKLFKLFSIEFGEVYALEVLADVKTLDRSDKHPLMILSGGA
jgi:hypothetical protein